MKLIYLAGRMTGRPKKAVVVERMRATRWLNRAGLDVFDPVSIEEKEAGVSGTFTKKQPLSAMRKIVAQEKAELNKCDALVVLTASTVSDGAWTEMGYAKYVLGIPIVLVSRLRAHGKLVSWSNIEATYIVSGFAEAAKVLKKHFKVSGKRCKSCKQVLPLSKFISSQKGNYVCTKCRLKRKQLQRKENPKKFQEKERQQQKRSNNYENQGITKTQSYFSKLIKKTEALYYSLAFW